MAGYSRQAAALQDGRRSCCNPSIHERLGQTALLLGVGRDGQIMDPSISIGNVANPAEDSEQNHGPHFAGLLLGGSRSGKDLQGICYVALGRISVARFTHETHRCFMAFQCLGVSSNWGPLPVTLRFPLQHQSLAQKGFPLLGQPHFVRGKELVV